jgi:hypothetical protein
VNERIRELINEATSFKEGLIEGKFDIEEFDKEKFAELIVRECMSNLYLNGYDDAMIQIQKHFGVEE